MNATTVVTGANRGIGLATAQLLADQGHEVVGTGRTAPENFPGTFYEVDFADSANLAAIGAGIAERHAVTSLVNNAGLSQARSIETVTMEDMDAHYQVNLRALVQLTQIMDRQYRQPGRRRPRRAHALCGDQGGIGRADAKLGPGPGP